MADSPLPIIRSPNTQRRERTFWRWRHGDRNLAVAQAEARGLRRVRAARTPWYWWAARVGVVVTLLLVGVGAYLYQVYTDPRRLRDLLLELMQQVVRSEVDIDEATFSFGDGLRVRGLEIYALPRLGGTGRGDRLVRVPELHVVPDWWGSLGTVFALEPQVQFAAIRVIQPELYVRFDADGHPIDEAILRTQPETDEDDEQWSVPPVEIQNARLFVEHPQFFSLEQRHRIDDLTVSLRPTDERDVMAITGTSASESWGRFAVAGSVHLARRELTLDSANRRLTVNRAVLAQLAPDIRRAIEGFMAIPPSWAQRHAPEVEPRVTVELEAGMHVRPGQPVGIDIRIAVIDANLAYEQFPVPVERVTGSVVVSNRPYPDRPRPIEEWELPRFVAAEPLESASSRDHPLAGRGVFAEPPGELWTRIALAGRYGHGRVRLDVSVLDLGTDDEQEAFRVEARDVLVDEAFVDALRLAPTVPDAIRDLFATFRPAGLADADFVIGGGRDPHLTVWLRDAQAEFSGFPLPVFRGHGRLDGWGDSWSLAATEALPLTTSGPVSLAMPPTVLFQDGSLGIQVSVVSPIVELTPEVVAALPPIGQRIVREYGLRGRGRLHASQFRTQSGGEIEFSLDIEPVELQMCWEQLPYPLVAVGGRVRIGKDGVEFDGIRARAVSGGATLRMDGTIRFFEDAPELDLTVTATRLDFDEQVWRALTPNLPPGQAPLFDASPLLALREMFAPQGRANLRCRIRGRHVMALSLTAELDGARGAYDLFPLPIEDLRGRVQVVVQSGTAHIQVRGVTGRYESARIRVDGSIQVEASGEPTIELTLRADGVTVGHDPRLRRVYEAFEARWLQARPAAGAEAEAEGAVEDEASAEEGALPAPQRSVLASAEAAAAQPVVTPAEDDSGEEGDGEGEDEVAPFRLFELFSAPRLPGGGESLLPGTTGSFDLVLHLGPSPDPAQTVHAVIEAELRGMSVIFAPLPYRLEEVHGRVVVDGGAVYLRNVRGRNGPSTVTITDGTVTAAGWDMRVIGRGMMFNAELHRALPAGVRPLYEVTAPTGRFDFAAIVQYRLNGEGAYMMQYDAEMMFHDSDVSAGLRFENLRGSAEVKGRMTADSHTATGRLRVHEGQWRGMKMHRVTCDLGYRDNVLSLPNVLGMAYGGFLRGYVQMDTTPGGEYAAFFQMTRLDVERLLREAFPNSAQLRGILDGELSLQGNLAGENVEAERGAFSGHGVFSILEGEIFQVPLVLKLFDFANWDRPTPIDEVQAVFTMGANAFHFSRFDMISDAVGLYGRGTIGYDLGMDMRFTMDFTPRLNLSAPLRAVVQFLEQTLLPIYITGPIYDPKIQPVFRAEGE